MLTLDGRDACAQTNYNVLCGLCEGTTPLAQASLSSWAGGPTGNQDFVYLER